MKRFLIGACLAGVAGAASAADLPPSTSTTYAAPAYAPAFTWTGVYFGVNGGGGWGGTSNGSFGNLSGWTFGGTAGGNYQFNQFVVGVEGDWDWANVGHTQTFPLTSNKMTINETLTLRARAGFAMDRALFFVTGGYGGVNANASFSTPLAGWGGSQTQWISGGAIGAGVEYAFTNHITVKGEYLYLPLASTTFFNSGLYSTRAPVDLSLLRAGLNYKF